MFIEMIRVLVPVQRNVRTVLGSQLQEPGGIMRSGPHGRELKTCMDKQQPAPEGSNSPPAFNRSGFQHLSLTTFYDASPFTKSKLCDAGVESLLSRVQWGWNRSGEGMVQ